jgi:hypothetical protein
MLRTELDKARETIIAAMDAARKIPPAVGTVAVSGWTITHALADGTTATYAYKHAVGDELYLTTTIVQDGVRRVTSTSLHNAKAVQNHLRAVLVDLYR